LLLTLLSMPLLSRVPLMMLPQLMWMAAVVSQILLAADAAAADAVAAAAHWSCHNVLMATSIADLRIVLIVYEASLPGRSWWE